MLRYLTLWVGLALSASPGYSQDYIDLEKERRQLEVPPIEARPADAPRLGDGLPPLSGRASSQAGFAPPQPEGPTQNFGDLLYRIQILQQEVMELRGQMEEQAHQLRQLKQQSLDRYVDLDQRLAKGGGVGVVDSGSAVKPKGASATTTEMPGEADAYQAAYSEVRSQQFTEAVIAFKQFLQDYPVGRYAPNAHYWLGELYLVITPQNLELSRQAFTLLLEQYPKNNKVPDALYKLGKVYFQKGNPEKAREYLDRVIKEHGSSNNPAVKLARDFIDNNY